MQLTLQKRDNFIDIMKGIGIILVFWGHSSKFLFNEIYAFHMPLFFLLSGCFFSTRLSFLDFIKKKFKHLLIPYVIFSLLSYIYYWIILILTGRFSMQSLYSLKEIIPINNELINAPLWFFWALFWMSIIYYLLRKLCKENNSIILLICIGLHIIEFYLNRSDLQLPIYLGRSLREIIYMHIGYCIYRQESILSFFNNKKIGTHILFGIISVALFISSFLIQDRLIDTKSLLYPLISILTAIFGISISASIAKIIELTKIKRIFEYLGTHTLCLFAIHLPLLEISRPIAKRIFTQDSFLYGFTSFTIILILSIIIGELLMLVFPQYLGKSYLAKYLNKRIS